MVTTNLARLALLVMAAASAFPAERPTPTLEEARVTLPYPELKALWQAAHSEIPQKRKPPVEAALLSARYQLVLKGDLAAGLVDYEVENFTDEWITIPLLGAQIQIDEFEPADVQ